MKVANYISWGLLALALIAAGYYWWSRRNPAGYFGTANTNYKMDKSDHLNLIFIDKWGQYIDGWDGDVVRPDGVTVKKVDYFFERFNNKIKPDMAYLGVPSAIINDELFNQYVFGFYKGANIEMTGLETSDKAFTAALAKYLKSGKIAYGPELVSVGQFLNPAEIAAITADAADGFVSVQNLGADQAPGLENYGYTGQAPVNWNEKPDGSYCAPGEGWCDNAGKCVPISGTNVQNGVVGYFDNTTWNGGNWIPCSNWTNNVAQA